MSAVRPGGAEQEALLQQLRRLAPEKRATLLARLNEGKTAKAPEEAPEIPRLGIRLDAPLSYAQERLWFLEQLDPGLPVYNIPVGIRLRGRLDRGALAAALQGVVARHEVLRARFRDHAGRPVQSIAPLAESPIPLPLVDLRGGREGGAGAAREAAARRLAQKEAARPFDLGGGGKGPLLRARLLQLEDEEHLLLLTLHHIAGDVWSLGVLLSDLSAFYAGRPLPELPVQYTDYAIWQRDRLSGEMLERQLDFWRGQLAGVPALRLPADRRRPLVPTQRGGQVPAEIDLPTTEALRQLGREAGATLFMVLLAGYEAVLSRHSGQDDFAVGTAVANRDRRELFGLIGFFVNVLALRANLSGGSGGGMTFRELLLRVREVTLAAYAHQDLPFERLVEELRPARDAAVAPLVQVSFQLQTAPLPVLEAPGLALASVPVETETAKFDLGATFGEHPGGLSGTLEYSADLFERSTAGRIASRLRRFLAAAAADPDGRIAELPLLPEAERRQVLLDWNQTAADWGPVRMAHELVADQVAKTPDAVAATAGVSGARGERALSYGELDRQAERLARHLRALGVGPEERVGLCLPRGLELLIAILGVMKAGGAYVPLDPAYPPDRLAFMIEDAAPRVVITAEQHRALISSPVLLLEEGRVVPSPRGGGGLGPGGGQEGGIPVTSNATPSNAAYLIYTSGSTGRPKGVIVPHHGLFHSIQEDGARWLGRRPLRVLQLASPSFDASVAEFFHALAWGGTLVHGAPGPLLPGPELVRLLREQEVEVASLTPSVLAQLDPAALPALDVIPASSEPLPAEVVESWAPGRHLWNAYGPTECTIGSTTSACSPEKLPPPIGVPIKNARAYVLEPSLVPAPVGVPGELYIGGQGVTRGYLNRPELTAERFLPDPWGPPGSRLYRTGDRVRFRTDGELDFLGRLDHQVKLRGFRIEPGEIEAALRKAPGVRDAVVLLREDTPGDPRLVAYVTHAANAANAADTTRELALWPSVAEYFVYDEALYYALTHDDRRNERYRKALGDLAGKAILDVGTGADLILTRLCLEAGARRVYAIEKIEATFRRAQATIARLGIADRCVLLHADATALDLPEPVDVCVSEIVGPIGGSEGAAPILDGARRALAPGGRMVPERSVTRIAAFTLPDRFLESPRFAAEAAPYVERIFAEVGQPFDLRLCLKGFSPDFLISDRGIFEDLDFERAQPRGSEQRVALTIERPARLDGFVLWLHLELGAGEEIDVLEGGYAWLPVFLPAFSPGALVAAGDRIEATVSAAPSDNGVNPDYRIAGVLLRQEREPVPFALDLAHHPKAGSFRTNPFYERLWAGYSAAGTGSSSRARELRDHLARQLPGYMVPSAVVVLPELPLLPNGKLDRRALPAPLAPDAARPESLGFAAPKTPFEEILAGIWAEVLGVPRISVEDDFFTDLGGHSLLATQVVSRLRDRVGIELPLRSLFESPTVRRWAALAEAAAGETRQAELPILRRAVPEGAPVPLSFAQERLWLLDQITPGLPTYNLPSSVRIAGRLDVPALERALRALVARHESLRTRFGEAEGRPAQVIAPAEEVDVPLPLVEVPSEGEAERLAAAEASRPFDLRRGPLLRAALLRLGEEDHLLLLTLHHIVADGWSLGVLVSELSALYAGRPLPELPLQYPDYALWQRERLSGEALTHEIEHWREALAGVPALDLPADHRRPAFPTHRGGRLPIELGAGLAASLRKLGRESGGTLFMTLFAGFSALLARYTGEDELPVGTVVANRPRRDLEGLIGFFVNTLVLRADLSGVPTFRDHLARVRRVTLDAYAYQELPFERLVEELRPSREGSQPPLVQALLVLQNTPLTPLTLPGLSLTPVEAGNGMAKFDLSALLVEEEEEDGISGVFEYAAELFEPATVERLGRHLHLLLEAAAADPEKRVGELPMLAEVERRQLLQDWNETAVDWGPVRPAHELFAARAAAAPDAPALFSGGLAITYGELNRRANRLAHLLRARGVGPEVRVGLKLERGPDFILSLLAVLKAGGVYVPLDPAYPAERLAFLIEDSAPRVVLDGADPEVSFGGRAVAGRAGFPDSDPPPLAGLENGAYVIYTSGSTGKPKGALVEHRNLVSLLCAIARLWDLDRPLRPRRVLQFSSPSFDASVGEIWAALPWGGALVHGRRGELLPAPEFAALVTRHGVDLAILPPSLLALLDPADFPGLATLVAAGEACSGEVAARWSPGRRMWNGYGPTECTVFSTTALCSDAPPPIGRPIPNARAYVLSRDLEPAPVGVPGELYIGGPGLSRGYLDRPDLTALRFVPDPWGGPGLRLYRTGDRVRFREDGEIDYLGRLDRQVKLRGFRIELGEVESVLRESPEVREAVAILREDTPGDPRLVAYVAPLDGMTATADLRRLCERRLPEHMVPSAFVVLDALPLSPNGKIDRHRLRRLPAPTLGTGFAPPESPLEEVVAGVWAEVLGLERVSATDDFFTDLGGHSLLATQVVSRVREFLGRDLPLRSLFDASTVRTWAATIEELEAEPSEGAALERLNRTSAPLSFAQERLWFLEQLTPGLAVYNVPQAVRLRGKLDVAALAAALRALLARHETLRTRFVAVWGAPRQEIVANVANLELPLSTIDLRGLGEAPREMEAGRLAAEEASRPFDLGRTPLVRSRLLRLAAEEHLLLLTFHHIVSDGWSLGVALADLGTLYAGEPLPDLPVQYADYAVWQREQLQGEVLDRQLGYWRDRLAGLPTLELPADRPRPAVRRHRGGWVRVEIPADLAAAVRRLGRGSGATLFMTLLAGFAAVLSRYAGEEDVPVGTAIANRRRRELEGLLGFFVNTLVLRTDLSGAPPFGALLSRTRETTLGAYAHQDLPFERLVEELRPARDTGQNPLVQVMLVLQNTPAPRLSLPGLTLAGVPVEHRTAKLDLTLSLAELEDGTVAGPLEHDVDLFSEATAERFAGHLVQLLRAAAASPERAVSELPLLGEEERRQILADGTSATVDFRKGALVHGLFTDQAERTPDAVAVVAEGLTLSYAELERRTARLARCLREMGVGPESFVGVSLERSADLVIALLGVLRAGGAYVPLDPELPAARIAEMSAGLTAVVDGATPLLPSPLSQPSPSQGGGTPPAPSLRPSGANAVYAIYTSGSTGRPKGVINTHAGVVNRVLWMQIAYGLTPQDRVVQKTPYSFDVSVWEFFWPLAAGASIVVARPGGHRDPDYLADLIASEGATVLHFVPSMLAAFLTARGISRCPGLRMVFASGEALPDELRRRFYSQSLPGGAALHNLYGPTEAAVDVTAWACFPNDPPAATVPIGRPIANVEIHVLDSGGEPAPVGVPGELHIGGIGLARGYLDRPDLTAERFVPNPWAEGRRLYRTGDRARFRQGGELEFLGRLDFQVKLRGFRVEPGEIAAVLAESPDVAEAAVLLRDDLPGGPRLVAYVVPAGPALDPSDLARVCRERLPAYMVPAAFVALPRLPLLPNGKLDRRALPAPEESPDAAARFIPPATPLEEILAGIWAEVLGRPRVSVTEGFFADLGGHSLLATQVVSRVRERLGLELPLRTLFEAPTVRAWAELAETTSPISREPILHVSRAGDLPLSYAQERLWFLEQLLPGLPVYNLPLAVELTGTLDRAALVRALAAVVARHEVLRTGFRTEAGRPVQAIALATDVPLPMVDLSALADPESETTRLTIAEAQRLFDLRHGPLLRGLLLRLKGTEHRLLLTLHHIASDGWSLGVLVSELSALYAGKPLPELPIQYADFAAWQRGWLTEAVLTNQVEPWRKRLAGVPVLDLPTDRPRPAVSRHRGAQLRALLPDTLAESLRKRSRETGVTLFMTLLSGFAAVLSRWSGQEDVPVGTAVANRRRRELESLIGFFVNTLALRTDLTGEPSFGDLLSRVREVALEAYEHQDLPFEKLVAELKPARDTGHEPLVQVSFLLQNAPMPGVELQGLTLAALPTESRTAKLDLLVSMTETESGIASVWEYDSDLFDEATIERLARHHQRLLGAALAFPELPVFRLPLLDDTERREILAWATGVPNPVSDLPVHALFTAQAERTPERVALVFGDLALTYGELDRRARALAGYLKTQGVGPDDRVGLQLGRGPDLVTGILGVLLSGGTYLPLDPSYPAERLAFLIEDAAPRLVLSGLPPLAEVSAAPALVPPESGAYLLFTSGSTGRPKGVAMPHGPLVNLIAWQLRETPKPARTLQLAPASFDVSFQELFSTLGGGGTLVLVEEETRRDPHALLRFLDRERIERLFLPMTALQQLAQAWPAAGHAASALSEILTAGERLQLTEEVLALLRALPSPVLWNQYGPTESHVVTANRLAGGFESGPAWPAIGNPVASVPVHVLDAALEPAPVCLPGEIYIGGIALARGYFGRPDQTAERFVPDPFGERGGRLYRTGDRARRLASGEIEYLGRIDQQVKLRGYRIEPGEIEAVLAGAPGVREAAVTVREDRPGDPRLVAYVVPEGEANAVALPDLRRRCQEFLPAFMVPAAFVLLDRLPLLASGKLDRRALPAAGGARPELAARYVAPEAPLERAVAEAWKELLQVDRVGLHDNFFDLGGHSLLAVRLHGVLTERLGREFSVIDLFRYPTVESFARFLARPEGEGAAPLREEKSERLVAGRDRLAGQQAARRAASRRRTS